MLKRLFLSLALTGAVAASAAAQERQWSLDSGDGEAYLVFGVPESDDIGISLWCTMQSGRVKLFLPEGDPDLKVGITVRMTVTVGTRKFRYKAKTSPNEEGATTSAETSMSATDPLFDAMIKADRFKVKVGREEQVYPLADADVAGLQRVCRKP